MRKYYAEAIGTFVLVFGGLGSAIIAGPKIGNLGVGISFGMALLAMVYAIGPISGCHINPAVTLGALITRKIEPVDAALYVVAQIIGAIVGAALLLAVAKGLPGGYSPGTTGFGANGFGSHSPGGYSMGSALLTEVILTALLVFTVLRVTDVEAPVGFAGMAIGLVLVTIHLVGIPVDNLSANPARSIGPALFVGGWALSDLWLFIVGPLIGGAVAAGAYLLLQEHESITLQRAEQALPEEIAARV